MRHLIGNKVAIIRDIGLAPYAHIRAGERGCVVHVTDTQGQTEVWVFLDEYHKGLAEWDNCIWLNEFDDNIWNCVLIGELLEVA